MNIEVRTATADDAPAVAEAHIRGWAVGYRGVVADEILDDAGFHEARRTGWTRRLTDGVPEGAGDPDNRILVGSLDGAVVGFAHCGLSRNDDGDWSLGEVYAFYLHPDAWGSGVAAAMMAESLAELRGRGFPKANLWVLRDNPRARRFYEKAGWSATGAETTWAGPIMPNLPTFDPPFAEVEYTIELTGSDESSDRASTS